MLRFWKKEEEVKKLEEVEQLLHGPAGALELPEIVGHFSVGEESSPAGSRRSGSDTAFLPQRVYESPT